IYVDDMTLIKTEALILRTIPFRESSSIVRMFTREQGKVSVIAKGARRLKSTLRGFLESLNYVEAIYYYKSTRDIQTLSKIDLIHSYFSNVPDIECNILGQALLETIDKVVHDHQHDHEIFDSSVQHLGFMDHEPEKCKVAFIRFLFTVTDILGYRLDVNSCPRCRTQLTSAVYDPGSARLICVECGHHLSSGHRFTETDIGFLKDPAPPDSHLMANQDKILRMLIHYLSYHLDIALNLKSLQLLSDLNI
ncbi:MAG: DNA repair protein RecO, partial [Candidatus Marinimicrobia bacterium]|nr:DNA repair protein RecO [Candidatus Neomarinimicrobiota bacterium]